MVGVVIQCIWVLLLVHVSRSSGHTVAQLGWQKLVYDDMPADLQRTLSSIDGMSMAFLPTNDTLLLTGGINSSTFVPYQFYTQTWTARLEMSPTGIPFLNEWEQRGSLPLGSSSAAIVSLPPLSGDSDVLVLIGSACGPDPFAPEGTCPTHILSSLDEGRSWTIENGVAPFNTSRNSLPIVAVDGNVLVAVDANSHVSGTQPPLLFSSSDRGATWSPSGELPRHGTCLFPTLLSVSAGVWTIQLRCISFGPLPSPNSLTLTSDDKGVTWELQAACCGPTSRDTLILMADLQTSGAHYAISSRGDDVWISDDSLTEWVDSDVPFTVLYRVMNAAPTPLGAVALGQNAVGGDSGIFWAFVNTSLPAVNTPSRPFPTVAVTSLDPPPSAKHFGLDLVSMGQDGQTLTVAFSFAAPDTGTLEPCALNVVCSIGDVVFTSCSVGTEGNGALMCVFENTSHISSDEVLPLRCNASADAVATNVPGPVTQQLFPLPGTFNIGLVCYVQRQVPSGGRRIDSIYFWIAGLLVVAMVWLCYRYHRNNRFVFNMAFLEADQQEATPLKGSDDSANGKAPEALQEPHKEMSRMTDYGSRQDARASGETRLL